MELLEAPPCDPYRHGEHPIVTIELLNGRVVRIQLEPSAAPITVAYFLKLVDEGFYDKLTFHRLVHNFILQGGCPEGTGDGETEFYVKGEFAENGIENPVRHTKGAISMARQDGCDTASCQFFIMLRDVPSMDGHYCAFGQVIEGMDAIDMLATAQVDVNSRPFPPLLMERVWVEK